MGGRLWLLEQSIRPPEPPFPWSAEKPGAWTKAALEPPALQTRGARNKGVSLSPGHGPFPRYPSPWTGVLRPLYANHLSNCLWEEGEAQWHLMSRLI